MNDIERDFFDEYKKLDNLCKDCFNSEQGVSAYIEEMDNTEDKVSAMIAYWGNDYKKLKHIRWVRNMIAHSDEESECGRDDIEFVLDFYQRIISRRDPLAMASKVKENFAKKVQPTIGMNTRYESDRGFLSPFFMLFLLSLIMLGLGNMLSMIINQKTLFELWFK